MDFVIFCTICANITHKHICSTQVEKKINGYHQFIIYSILNGACCTYHIDRMCMNPHPACSMVTKCAIKDSELVQKY